MSKPDRDLEGEIMKHAPKPWEEKEDDFETASREIAEAVAMEAEIEQAIAPYSKGLDDDPGVLWAEAIAFVRRAQEDIFEAGRRLIVLKERLGHGNFIKELDARGLERTTAWRTMAITRKFANVTALQHLAKSKQYLLASATDEEIQQLEETGRIMDIPQEELAGMSYREIQRAIRKYKEKLKKRDEQIVGLDAEKRDMERELDRARSLRRDSNANWAAFQKAEEHIQKAILILGDLDYEAIKDDFEFGTKVAVAGTTLQTMVNNIYRMIVDRTEDAE